MLTKNVALMFFLSLLAAFLMWLFNADTFSQCYIPYQNSVAISFVSTENLQICLAESASIIVTLLMTLPGFITLIAALSYQIYNKQKLSYRYYILWISWLGTLYYCIYHLYSLSS